MYLVLVTTCCDRFTVTHPADGPVNIWGHTSFYFTQQIQWCHTLNIRITDLIHWKTNKHKSIYSNYCIWLNMCVLRYFWVFFIDWGLLFVNHNILCWSPLISHNSFRGPWLIHWKTNKKSMLQFLHFFLSIKCLFVCLFVCLLACLLANACLLACLFTCLFACLLANACLLVCLLACLLVVNVWLPTTAKVRWGLGALNLIGQTREAEKLVLNFSGVSYIAAPIHNSHTEYVCGCLQYIKFLDFQSIQFMKFHHKYNPFIHFKACWRLWNNKYLKIIWT